MNYGSALSSLRELSIGHSSDGANKLERQARVAANLAAVCSRASRFLSSCSCRRDDCSQCCCHSNPFKKERPMECVRAASTSSSEVRARVDSFELCVPANSSAHDKLAARAHTLAHSHKARGTFAALAHFALGRRRLAIDTAIVARSNDSQRVIVLLVLHRLPAQPQKWPRNNN